MNTNQMWRVDVLSETYNREMILGGPLKTSRSAADFAMNAYSNMIRARLRRAQTVMIKVTRNVDGGESTWYDLGMRDDKTIQVVRARSRT